MVADAKRRRTAHKRGLDGRAKRPARVRAISVRIDTALYEQLRREAREDGRSFAGYIRWVLPHARAAIRNAAPVAAASGA
jgi:hypothetical protein